MDEILAVYDAGGMVVPPHMTDSGKSRLTESWTRITSAYLIVTYSICRSHSY